MAESQWIIACQQEGNCQTTEGGEALFIVTNAVPGQTSRAQLQIINNVGNHDCTLYLDAHPAENSTTDIFAVLVMAIKDNVGRTLLTKRLQDKQDIQKLGFDVLPSGNTRTYTVEISLPLEANNQLQGKQSFFDLDTTIQCYGPGELPTPPPVPSPTPVTTPTATSGAVLGVSTPTISSEPKITCTDQPPPTISQLELVSKQLTQSKVELRWQPVVEATEYWIEFGNWEGSEHFRHRGVVLPSHVLKDLSTDEDTFIQVRSVHGCAVSPPSPWLKITADSQEKKTSDQLGQSTKSRYSTQQYLDTSLEMILSNLPDTTNTKPTSASPMQYGRVLGMEAEQVALTPPPWPIGVALLIGVIFLILLMRRRRQKHMKKYERKKY